MRRSPARAADDPAGVISVGTRPTVTLARGIAPTSLVPAFGFALTTKMRWRRSKVRQLSHGVLVGVAFSGTAPYQDRRLEVSKRPRPRPVPMTVGDDRSRNSARRRSRLLVRPVGDEAAEAEQVLWKVSGSQRGASGSVACYQGCRSSSTWKDHRHAEEGSRASPPIAGGELLSLG